MPGEFNEAFDRAMQDAIENIRIRQREANINQIVNDEPFYINTWETSYTIINDNSKKKKKELETITFDDEKMLDIKLNSTEISKAVCTDIELYYKKYIKERVSGWRAINSLVHFNNTKQLNKKAISTTNKGILIGYSYNGKVYDSATEIVKTNYELSKVNAICKCYIPELNKYKTITTNVGKLATFYVTEEILKTFKIKIIGSELSGKVFGKTQDKTNLIGSIFKNFEITKGNSKRIGETYYIIINVQDKLNNKEKAILPDQQLKFVLSDIELILPNIKGYNQPIDKTINKGSNVIVINPKFSLYKNQLLVVSVKPDRTSKRINNSSNRRLDIVNCITTNGEALRIYAKDLKIIK